MKTDFDSQKLTAILLIAGALALAYVSLMPEKPGRPKDHEEPRVSARSSTIQDSVNKHLEQTASQLDLQRRRIELENRQLLLQQQDQQGAQAYHAPSEGTELKQEDPNQINGDPSRGQSGPTSPMEVIQQQVYLEQQMRQMDDMARKEYARQFVENARRGGYEIQLGDDFRVLSVKPIRKPAHSFQLFEGQ